MYIKKERIVLFNLSSIELSHFLISMAILLAFAHLLGYLAERLADSTGYRGSCSGISLRANITWILFPRGIYLAFCWFSAARSNVWAYLPNRSNVTHVLFRIKVSYEI